jgi:hypothetical protein
MYIHVYGFVVSLLQLSQSYAVSRSSQSHLSVCYRHVQKNYEVNVDRNLLCFKMSVTLQGICVQRFYDLKSPDADALL